MLPAHHRIGRRDRACPKPSDDGQILADIGLETVMLYVGLRDRSDKGVALELPPCDPGRKQPAFFLRETHRHLREVVLA